MSNAQLWKFGGGAMAVGGLLIGAFWVLVLRLGTFVGAKAVLDPLWAPAQWIHVVGATVAVFGLAGLYGAARDRLGVFGLIGFAAALIGAMCFFTDGVIALVIFPAVARTAPSLLEATGALNVPPVLFAFIAFAVFFMIGHVVFSTSLFRAKIFPGVAVSLYAFGAVVANLPPGPVPSFIIASGGIVYGLGAIWLGLAALALSGQN